MRNLMSKLLHEQESYLIRKAIFEVYKTFRNRHKEMVYHNALVKALQNLGLTVEKNKRLPVKFQGTTVGTYVPDVVVNNIIVLELKSKPFLTKSDREQFWEYLKATDYDLGFLINFGKSDGVEISRFVYQEARKQTSA